MKTSNEPAAKFSLREDFAPHSYEAWRAAAEKLLKGASFEDVLKTQTYEDLTLSPIYWPPESLEGLPQSLRSERGNRWDVTQEIFASDPAAFNRELRDNLKKGQTAVRLDLSRGQQSPKIESAEDFAVIFESVDLTQTPFFLHSGNSNAECGEFFKTFCAAKNIETKKLTGALSADPLGELAKSGALPKTLANIFDEIAKFTRWSTMNAPGLKTLLVNASSYHKAGADAVTELAVAMATAAIYVREMLQRDFEIDEIAPKIMFQFSVGGHFFVEIAKLRAAKVLWHKIVEAFGGEGGEDIFIHAETSQINKSFLDPHVNMLRATSEAMAAVLGGCQSLSVSAFDENFRTPNDFSLRIARNVQTILREEAHLGRVDDPAGGSWFAESLTKELAQKAWALFQEIEAIGGMVAALESGFIQKRCADKAEARLQNITDKKDKMIGVNVFPNLQETLSFEEKAAGNAKSSTPKSAAVTVEPLKPIRLAEKFEAERLVKP